ncbi:MAG: permease-like cell division protein FtsX [Bacillota bacterium]|nr:permease-like cell division protein FtsX [Bacillota bacterium]
MRNFGYYIREALTLIRLGLGRSMLTVFSLGLLLVFSLVSLTIWITTSHYVERLKDETMIAVYYTPELNEHALKTLEDQIRTVEGVREIRRVGKDESKLEMERLLGDEADILARFSENPFEAYLRVAVAPDIAPASTAGLSDLSHVTYVRDHRTVLAQVRKISDVAGWIGMLTITAAVASAVMITYFMTSESVLNHRQQIIDLRLMGAPESFIAIPFLLQGLLTNLTAAFLAGAIYGFGIKMLPLELGFGGAGISWELAVGPVMQLLIGVPLVGLIAGLRAVASKRNFA